MREDEIPQDDDVMVAVGQGTASPSDVLKTLMDRGHSRAASQRAMQRALDRDKIAFNSDLKLLVTKARIAA